MVLVNVMRGGPGPGQHRAVPERLLPGDQGPRPRRLPGAGPRARRRSARRSTSMADAFELAERYRTPVMILADGILGQAMEPVEPALPRRPRGTTGRLGADRRGRPAGRGSSSRSTSSPEDLERHNQHLQAKYADDRRARGPLGRRGPRGRRDRDRRLRHGRAGRPHGDRARPRARACGSACSARSRCGRSRRRELPRSPPRLRGDPGRRAVGRPDGRGRPLAVEGRTPGLLPRPDGRHGPDARRGRRRARPRLGDARRPPRPAAIAGTRADGEATDDRSRCRPVSRPTDPRRRRSTSRPDVADRPLDATTAPAAATASSTASSPRCSTSSDLGAADDRASRRSAARVFAYDYLDVDFVEAPHGRAPAVATGVRRVRPDAFVFTYQGDGDLAAIGTAEIVHAAARGERITRDLRQQRHLRHDRRPDGPDHAARPADDLDARWAATPALHGYPIPITEMLALLPGRRRTRPAARSPTRRRSARPRPCSGGPSRSSSTGGGLRDRRGPLELPGRLGHDARRVDGAPGATRSSRRTRSA